MSENRKRNETLTIRLNKSERERIAEKAAHAGLSLTEYILALSRNTPILVPPDLMPVLRELKRIGNNLNQIAARVNSGVAYVPDLKNVIEGQQQICQQLKEMTEATSWRR